MEATLEGLSAVRVRDVEIALVLAREMKAAAARDAEASLRLEQLKDVFGAEQLDRGERARIQTALQMAGLEPEPSLLDAGLDEPIRFAVTPDEMPAAAPASETTGEERQEFPTVGEFTRSTLRKFRRRRSREQATEVTAPAGPPPLPPAPELHEEPVALEPEPLLEEEPLAEEYLEEEPLAEEPVAEAPVAEEPVAEAPEVDEPEPEDPEVEEPGPDEPEIEDPEPEAFEDEDELDDAPGSSVNGHVEAGANGHPHFDFLDDAVLPPAEGYEPEPEFEEEPGPEPVLDYEPEHEPEPEPEPAPQYEPEPEPEPEPAAADPEPASVGAADVAAILFPLVAVPVLISAFAGWSFGLPFVALSLIATGIIAGRRGGLVATLRSSPAARTILKATVLVTAASLAISIVLANIGTKSTTSKSAKPAAQKPAAPKAHAKATPSRPQAAAPKPKKHRARRAHTTPRAPTPDPATSGLYRVTPGTGTGGTSTTPSGTATAPSGTTTTP
ncbi:MAG: Procyclic acidic repetitive protein [Thermoleophilaceae bacterium]|nr:Procyclic acidic repetitive protein [Thermoleophilaceae bacterium]